MCLVAILAGKTAAIVISLLQIAAAVVSILMHKGIIKLEQKKLWFKWLVLVAAILLLILNVYSYSWGRLSVDTNDDQHPIVTEPGDNEVVDDTKATETTAPICKTAILPFSDSEYIGQKREDIVNQLEQEGFINISQCIWNSLRMTSSMKVVPFPPLQNAVHSYIWPWRKQRVMT